MQPDFNLITINNNLKLIEQLLTELVLEPRINALKWSAITHQTPNLRIGYPGQHLASLITGIRGKKTGARGDDLADGTEVKSCSRIDQMDQCKNCKSPVARNEKICLNCGSSNIDRKDDSKWLFTIRSENDLKLLTEDVPRILLILGDYPNFDQEDFETLRFQAFEIWTNNERQKRFKEIMNNYYYQIYLENKSNKPKKIPAPQNFWPYKYQFYLCNPILTFSCIVNQASSQPQITINHYVEPHLNRSKIESILMPINLLYSDEKQLIRDYLQLQNDEDLPEWIDENTRSILALRQTNKGFSPKMPYMRASSKRQQTKNK
jgi:hypothetical protein